VLLSASVSVDGYLDDAGPERLVLSSPEDLDQVDELRAGVDAILVGAGTIRADNPRLLVRSSRRRQARRARGLPDSPAKVTLTGSAELDPAAAFFTAGDTERLVYVPDPLLARAKTRWGDTATVVAAGAPLEVPVLLADLAERGYGRLLVEGGQSVHTQFLTADVVDEVRLAVAPFFVGDPAAPRLVGPGVFPQSVRRRMRLAAVDSAGDTAVLRYLVR
jgi:5-amino-6-(5-phosphoribosylamino)uracil reductase